MKSNSLNNLNSSENRAMTINRKHIPTISNDGHGASEFSTREIELHGDPIRLLSEQQNCVNFRLRSSTPDFSSDFHVAGDPTLLLILRGTVMIELRNGKNKVFSKGDLFIAEDYLAVGAEFDSDFHGHRSKVLGDEILDVLHLKLEKRVV